MPSKVELLKKYVWIVDAFSYGRRLTFKEISDKWLASNRWQETLVLRTFHRYRNAIQELFGIDISWNRNGNVYYIEHDDSRQSEIISRLFTELSVVNQAMEDSGITDRILFERSLSGYEYLSLIVESLTTRRVLKITYRSMGSGMESELMVCPHSLHQFGKRWYLLATVNEQRGVYALDRIEECQLTEDDYKFDPTLNPKTYFDEVIGVNLDDEYDCEDVVFRIYGGQRSYVEEIPLHKTQKRICYTKGYSDYRVKVRPEYEFIHEILRLGQHAEILSPEWVREEVRWQAEQIIKRYDPK